MVVVEVKVMETFKDAGQVLDKAAAFDDAGRRPCVMGMHAVGRRRL
jgi:hypothetical protein